MKYKKNIAKIVYLSFLGLALFSFFSCNKRPDTTPTLQVEVSTRNHEWNYFTKDGFYPINLPQNAPLVLSKPWTESIRIAESVSSPIVSENTSGKALEEEAFAAVNHLGILKFSGKDIFLFPDTLFKDKTVSSLFFINSTPVFSLYKNTFFNTNEKNLSSIFLAQFKTDTGVSYPLVTTENLKLEDNSEITDFYYDGKFWFCSVKSESNNKIRFEYIKWNATSPVLSLSPKDASKKIEVEGITEDFYRKLKTPIDFKFAPERAKSLFKNLPKNFSFYVECITPSEPQSKSYIRKNIDSEEMEALNEAKMQLTDIWACAIFSDGTTYFSGALKNRSIFENGKTVALRLPKLPEGFTYSSFAISGDYMYVAWEETSFFETARSGFLTVNLGKVLYND